MWRSNRSKGRTTFDGTHHQRSTGIWRWGETKTRDDQGNGIYGQSRSVRGDHPRSSNRRREEEHHMFQTGSSKQRRWSQVTHRWPRLWRSHQRLRWRLFIDTTLCNPQGHCIGKILEHQGRRYQHDISTCLSWSNNKHRSQATNRVLHQQEHLLEIEESNVWSQVITKSLASIMRELGYKRLTSEPNVCKHPEGKAYIMVYVDDLLFIGERRDQQHLQQSTRKDVTTSNWRSITRQHHLFLGEKITNKGDHVDISLDDEYVDNIFQEMKLSKCNPATTTGTTAGKANIEDEQSLDQQEHQQFRRLVGKLQWLAYTRPDISYATKELARALQQPTIKDQKKLRHLVRYLPSTRDYKFRIRPTIKLYDAATTGLEHLCSLRLGRMSLNKTKHNRLCHRTTWHLHPLWIQNTSSGSTVISRSWILRHRHWSTRSALHQDLRHGSLEHKAHQRAHPHRQLSRQVHGNKARSIKMSKKHRTQIHVHPEPHPRRRGITTQDTNQRQTGRHPHKVCDSRSAEMAHLQHRHQHSLKPSYSKYHQYVCNKHTSQHTDIRQIWLSHGRTQTSAATLNAIMHLVFFKKYQRATS